MKTDRRFFAGAALVLAAAGLVALLGGIYAFYVLPVGPEDKTIVVQIDPGSDLGRISRNLEQAGVLSRARLFFWAARLARLEKRLRAGQYELETSWNLQTLLDTLASGRSRLVAVTFPEGLRLEEIARRLEAAGVTEAKAFLARSRDRSFLDSLGIPGPTAEGFLYPETYLFSAASRPEDVIAAMYRQFTLVFQDLLRTAPAPTLSMLHTTTLASLVEKETALPQERPLVAAVFLNRLRLARPLQCDPSVIYGIANFDGNLTRRDLQTDSPYNTYLHRGLPPGPIASPGRDSLRAALLPADKDFLYFVSRNDGSHHFSRTLAEHNRAVRRYQLARKSR